MVNMDEKIIKTLQAAELTDEQLEKAAGGFDTSIFYDPCPSCKGLGIYSGPKYPKTCILCGYTIERKISPPDFLDELTHLKR